jgi:hypothetical protein
MGAGITVMITGITKSIALMKTAMQTTSASFVDIRNKIPNIIENSIYNKVYN